MFFPALNGRGRAAVLSAALILAPPVSASPPSDRLAVAPSESRPRPVVSRSTSGRPDLAGLLEKAAAYCARLENAALDFVCRERITETVDPSLDVAAKPGPRVSSWNWQTNGATMVIARTRKAKRTLEYDYQCVRSEGAIEEKRTLLKVNGKKINVPEAGLETSIIVFGTALMGPVGLFGERFQPQYDYTIAGEDKVENRRVVVVSALPKPGAPETRNLYGAAWIDAVTADILRIEWSENRVGRYEIFEKRGELYGRTPRLVIRSEFSEEKNGIRFPSRLVVEEAYLDGKGRAVVRSETEVVYGDFKFFTVEVEVRRRPGSRPASG